MHENIFSLPRNSTLTRHNNIFIVPYIFIENINHDTRIHAGMHTLLSPTIHTRVIINTRSYSLEILEYSKSVLKIAHTVPILNRANSKSHFETNKIEQSNSNFSFTRTFFPIFPFSTREVHPREK